MSCSEGRIARCLEFVTGGGEGMLGGHCLDPEPPKAHSKRCALCFMVWYSAIDPSRLGSLCDFMP